MTSINKITGAMALALSLMACQQKVVSDTATTIPDGMRLIADQSEPKAQQGLTYQKYQLANGLTLLVHEDHSDPLVHVDVTYHVGSAREEPGKSGFAHFFEHMMFQGSEHVADEQHFKLITEAGGSMNGSTNNDSTNYYQTVPVNQLEKVLWLESDRMGYLLDAVTEKKFEVQRETVKNERGQRVDNQPYGLLQERVAQALYPQNHPYSWPVIGYMADLNRANVNDVKAFFLRWYGPNNATLTIGGDVKAAEILPLVQKYFGAIPVGPAVQPAVKSTFSLEEDRYISLEDNVHLPLLYLTFPTVYARHPDEAPLDILAEILGGGNNSLLYKNLVKPQLAVQAQTGHGCMELACNFTLLALPHPAAGKNLAAMEQLIRQSLTEFEQRGVTDDDLLKVKAQIEAEHIFGLQSVAGKVGQLAYNQTFFAEPDLSAADLARYNNVTKTDVMRVYQQYIQHKHAVIMSVVPKGQTQLIAHADTFTPPAPAAASPSSTKASDLTLRRAKVDFDRTQIPKAGANPAVSPPQSWRQQFDNGITLLGSQSLETPTTAILLKVPTGLYYEQPAQVGISSMLASLMNESSTQHSTEAMSLALEKLGSSIRISADNQYINVFVSSLSKNLQPTLDLMQERLFQPAFSAEDFSRVQQQKMQGLQHAQKDAGYLAERALSKLMFGDHIISYDNQGTLETLANLTPAAVQSYYQSHFKPQGSQLIVVSDLSQPQLVQALQSRLAAWQGAAPKITVTLPPAPAVAGTIYLLDKPDAPQSEIIIAKRSMAKDISGEYFRAGLMNFALGGNFNSRLNLNLREDKGYTYGARAGFSGGRYGGLYTATAAVRADATAASIQEFFKEISAYHQQGLTDDEVQFMRSAINQADALKYETPQAKLGFMAQILEYQLSNDFVRERNQIVSEITKEQLNELAKKHLDPASLSVIVVGDAKKLQPELDKLGMPVKSYTF